MSSVFHYHVAFRPQCMSEHLLLQILLNMYTCFSLLSPPNSTHVRWGKSSWEDWTLSDPRPLTVAGRQRVLFPWIVCLCCGHDVMLYIPGYSFSYFEKTLKADFSDLQHYRVAGKNSVEVNDLSEYSPMSFLLQF